MTNPVLSLLDLWSRRYLVNRPAAPVATRPAVVVTGASEGIGLALSRRFAEAGHLVVLVARREAMLSAAIEAIRRDYGVEAVALPLDVNNLDAAERIEAALDARGLHVEVLINNAGFGLSGAFETMPEADIEALISCNMAALTRLSRHFLPQMLARASGGLINVSSLAGIVPGPFQAAYYASKAYVISLTRAVAFETRGRGVRVAVVMPGPVNTEFHARMNADTSLYRYLVPSPSPELVAAAAYRGFRWHRRVIVPGTAGKILSLVLRIVPNVLVMPVIAWLLYPRPREAAEDIRGETR